MIFLYDFKKQKLRDDIKFSKDRDYEGITNAGDTLYVLCSNGELFKVWDLENEKPGSEVIRTPLTKQNNCEGLCYDAMRQRLLIACKSQPIEGTAPAGSRAVYAFDLIRKEFITQPVFVLSPDSVKEFLHSEGQSTDIIKENGKEIPFDFAPSEISIDPQSGDIYMLSSVGKTFLALESTGQIKCAIRLNPAIFIQPEGLTFKPNGDMLISDEGKDGKAGLVLIKRKKKKEDQ